MTSTRKIIDKFVSSCQNLSQLNFIPHEKPFQAILFWYPWRCFRRRCKEIRWTGKSIRCAHSTICDPWDKG